MAVEEFDIEELEQQFLLEESAQKETGPYWHFSDIKDILTADDQDSVLHRRFFKNIGKTAIGGLLAVTLGAGTALVGTFFTKSEGALGPVPGNEITLTRDNAITAKIGPDLWVVKPLDGQDGAGAEIVPQKVPDIDLKSPQNVAAILGGFGDAKEFTKEGKHAVWEHGKGLFEASTLCYGALIGGLYWSHGAARRKELAEKLFRGRTYIAALSALMIIGSINPWDSQSAEKARSHPGDAIFENTSLRGAYFVGKLGNDAKELIGNAVNIWNQTNDSYDLLMDNYEKEKQLSPILTARPGTKTLVLAANLKCNTFMNRFISKIYEDSGANALFISADSVTGSIDKLDEFCTNALGSALAGKTAAITDGNHKTPNVPLLEVKNGLILLDGKAVDVSIFRAIGVSDEYSSVYGLASDPETMSTINQAQGEKLGKDTCEQGGADILVGPDREIVDNGLKAGCAKLGLSGDRAGGIVWIKTKNGAYVAEETGANTGGVSNDQLTLGELKAPATIVIDQTSEKTGQLLHRQVITFFPGGDVIIGKIESPKPPVDNITDTVGQN